MADTVGDIIGDYRAFAALQRDRLAASGIDIAPYALSHLAYRVADWDLYLHLRTLLERHATANNGRRGITPSTALRLSRYFGTSSGFWMNGQIRWDLYHTQQTEGDEVRQIRRHPRAMSG
jgi:hypothetical protein